MAYLYIRSQINGEKKIQEIMRTKETCMIIKESLGGGRNAAYIITSMRARLFTAKIKFKLDLNYMQHLKVD